MVSRGSGQRAARTLASFRWGLRQSIGGIPLKHLVFAFLFSVIALAAPSHAAQTVHLIVLREHGLGSAAQAQPYVNELIQLFAKKNGWGQAKGKYITRRKSAEKYIKKKGPQFGILSLGAFLAMKKPHRLTVVGTAEVARAGGRQYHLISKDAGSVEDCKGKTLASNHLADRTFVEKVIANGAFKLTDFKVVKTRRPVQTIKKVSRGKAVCALIDDAQLAELSHIEGTQGIRSVWASKRLPPMAVVAFSGASGPARAKLKSNLSSVCDGRGQAKCDKVGILSIKPASDAAFAAVVSAYRR
jgi:hypothetical protein